MGLFSRFSKKDQPAHEFKSALLTVASKTQLTPDAVEIRFVIPEELKDEYIFKAGQYINVTLEVNGKKETRSYSICSGENEGLAIGVKKVDAGTVSRYLVDTLNTGDAIDISKPHGNFILKSPATTVVAFAAGSGITPILSLAKKQAKAGGAFHLFYGNKSAADTMFAEQLKSIPNCTVYPFYSREEVEGAHFGRMTKQSVSETIKANLSLLRAEHFFLCGPEDMIMDIQEVLTVFGVAKDHIHFELFTPPVKMVSEATAVTAADFSGKSQVSAVLDGEIFRIELDSKGPTVLEALDKAGADVPYSCRGGVCCTCRAKIIEGSATMKVNFALTDEEVKDGYILACQSHPTSEVLKIDFDA